MATLTKTERAQLRWSRPSSSQQPRWDRRPVREYLAFVAFVSRLTPEPTKVRLIDGGNHWKL